MWCVWVWFCWVWANVVAGAGDDASPRPNFDRSPEITDGEDTSKLTQTSQVASRNPPNGGKAAENDTSLLLWLHYEDVISVPVCLKIKKKTVCEPDMILRKLQHNWPILSNAFMNMAHRSKGCLSGCLLCQSVQWWVLRMGCRNNPTRKITFICHPEMRMTCACLLHRSRY